MKTIGLLGGMSWESTAEYYRIINQSISKSQGDAHSASIVMYSFDFFKIQQLQHQERWDQLQQMLSEKAIQLSNAGADFLVICTNTMHVLAPMIVVSSGLEVLHIVPCVAQAIADAKLKQVLLLGTSFTIKSNLYPNMLANYNIEVIVPNQDDQIVVHNVIYQELINGITSDSSREKIVNIIQQYPNVQGVILGCTELPLLIRQHDVDVMLFDTTKIHALAAAKRALE